jgi:hypothetical protein
VQRLRFTASQLHLNFFEDANQGFGAVRSDDVTIGFDLRPFAIDVGDVDDAGVRAALAKKPDSLAGGGRRQAMTQENDVIAFGTVCSLQSFFLGGQDVDLVPGGLEGASAQLRELRVRAQGEDSHG